MLKKISQQKKVASVRHARTWNWSRRSTTTAATATTTTNKKYNILQHQQQQQQQRGYITTISTRDVTPSQNIRTMMMMMNIHHQQKKKAYGQKRFSQWNTSLRLPKEDSSQEEKKKEEENKEEKEGKAKENKDEKEEKESKAKENKDEKEGQEEIEEERQQEEKKKEEDGDEKNTEKRETFFWIAATVIFLFTLAQWNADASDAREITFKELADEYLRTDQIDRIVFDTSKNFAYVYLKKDGSGMSRKGDLDRDNNDRVQVIHGAQQNESKPDFFVRALSVESFEAKLQDTEELLGIPATKSANIVYQENFDAGRVIISLLDIVILFGVLYFLQRRGGRMMDVFGPGKVKVRTDHKVTTTFNDVAGMTEAKQEIVEFVDFLKKPEKYRKLGATLPRGAILMGPPGTGKTLLARAVAGESDVPFFSMSGSDFVEMFVGVGPSRVRDLFKQARSVDKAIIYIDEIDAIGRPRGSGAMAGGGNDERENTLNQLLVEMDGFTVNSNIIVLASTNVDKDGLDPALLRPGRFDRQVTVDKPDHNERIEIFNVHFRPLKVSKELADHINRLAELTPGMSGADIANVCNEGAIYAARRGHEEVSVEDIESAIERVIGGLEKKNTPITPEEKKVIAYHEAGHAIVAWFCKFCDPLLKVSIIPRGKALGYAQYVPKETYIKTYDQLQDMLVQALGGRVAEQLVFNHLSTGAQDDLQKITQIAYAAVSSYGMSDSVGALSYPPPGDPSVSIQKPYGEETAWHIDEEVRTVISKAYGRAKDILTEKDDLLQKVAQFLIKNEVMSIDQFRELAGPRPYASDEKGIMPADAINLKELQSASSHIVLPPSLLNRAEQ